MRRQTFLLGASFLCACGSVERDYPVDSGAGDAAIAHDVAVEEVGVDVNVLPGFTRCGEPPYVSFTYQFNDQKKQPIAGVALRVNLCPEMPQTSDARGTVHLLLPRGAPLYFQIDYEPLHLQAIEGELSFELPSSTVTYLLPFVKGAPFPRPDEGRLTPVIYATLAAPPPCNDGSGVTFSVKDHPEAVVTFYDAAGPLVGVTTTTPASYVAKITGLAVGSYVVLEASKPGCRVRPYLGGADLDQSTGRSPIVAGHDTSVTVLISPLPSTSDAGADGAGD